MPVEITTQTTAALQSRAYVLRAKCLATRDEMLRHIEADNDLLAGDWSEKWDALATCLHAVMDELERRGVAAAGRRGVELVWRIAESGVRAARGARARGVCVGACRMTDWRTDLFGP